ncbi:calcium-binding protein [Bacillus fungorum]|uniref:Calcium-binding protein n=1 Tax=Bacillus fungorum TaxID=2039284 RepID=A0A2G6QBE5_9BACI|nr:excalibur calcium-binding domain-containing protein [Bacillus fungorum]PIE93739.1 calcium-binding protein [Bacillus fungorum]
MAILSNIGAALFFIAFILLILCIISFFKKNGKAQQYGRPTVILFMISIILIMTGTIKFEHPVIEFFAILSFILFIFFLVLAILSVIKKTGVAKKQFIITAVLFVIFVALSGISAPSSEKTKATSKKVASNNEEQKDSAQKKEIEKKEADEQARKQQEQQAQTQPANGNTNSTYYKNCDAVRAAGKAPLYKNQPGYSHKLDKDDDGVACEK